MAQILTYDKLKEVAKANNILIKDVAIHVNYTPVGLKRAFDNNRVPVYIMQKINSYIRETSNPQAHAEKKQTVTEESTPHKSEVERFLTIIESQQETIKKLTETNYLLAQKQTTTNARSGDAKCADAS